ncbi:hypothetical protein J4227_05680 [Candidatus Woesearchaeota archaeon]|nr:hypothetical protein [Candidatus Woesearchaeota archaeon]
MVEFRRKIYRRGSSYETTIPMPLLFTLDSRKKYNVIFRHDNETGRWYLEFEERPGNERSNKKRKK